MWWLGEDDKDQEEYELLNSGTDLPRAPTFFDLTGQTWRPTSSPRLRIPPRELAKIDALATQVAAEFNAVEQGGVDAMEIIGSFSDITSSALASMRPSIDVLEVFFTEAVRKAEYPIVFARDVGADAGYVSRSLSSHILAFPEQIYMARLGGLDFTAPFSNFESMGGWGQVALDSYLAFANEEPGREVLEISSSLRMGSNPVRDTREWVALNRTPTTEEEARYRGFNVIAGRAGNSQGRCRSWDDATEDALRLRIRGLAASLAPEGAKVFVTLDPGASKSSLHCGAFGSAGAWSDPRARILECLFDMIDLSGFRAISPSIQLINDGPFSGQERIAGIGVLYALCDEAGLDTGAVSEAMRRKDFNWMLRIVSSEDDEMSWHRSRADCAPEASLVWHGLEEDDLPY